MGTAKMECSNNTKALKATNKRITHLTKALEDAYQESEEHYAKLNQNLEL